MIETWLWPKASARTLSIGCGGDAEAAGGVAVDGDHGFQAVDLLIGVDVGEAGKRFELLKTLGAQVRSSLRSSPWRVYCYWALLERPPMRRS